MLSALGLGGAKKRWTPAAKLQKDGKMSKKAIIEYLEYGAIQIASAESVETIARVPVAENETNDSKYVDVFNDWQCQLMENRGYEINFARMSLDEWKNSAGNPENPKKDQKVIEAFDGFQQAIQVTLSTGVQFGHIRRSLQLGNDGKDEGEALMPRRAAKATEKLQTVGPVQRQKMIKFTSLARDVVLSFETRVQLGQLMNDYSTWKTDKLHDLLNKVILNWQYEVWESPELCIDHRLGSVELSRSMPRQGDSDLLDGQQNMFLACQALSTWFMMIPKKDALPQTEGRKYEPWSLADDAFKKAQDGVLFREGLMEPKQFEKTLQTVVDTLASEGHAKVLDEVAFGSGTADLRATERLMHELWEAVGVEHRYAGMLMMCGGKSEEVQKLMEAMNKAQGELKKVIMAGLRKIQEAKKAASESPVIQDAGGYPASKGA